MTVQDLLGVRYSGPALAVAADHAIDARTVTRLERAGARLRRVTETHSAIGVEAPPDAAEIARRFVRLATSDPARLPAAFATGRLARKLAASLCHSEGGARPIARSGHLPAALDLLRPHDRTSVLLGVLDALLRTWDDPAYANRLRAFLRPRLDAYRGKLLPLRRAQDNARFLLYADGADTLGAETATAGRPFGSAIDALALSARARTTPFTDQVAVAYARTALRTTHATDALHSLLSFLEERDRGVVHKRCLAPVILATDDRPDESVKDRLQTVAFHTIGDPAHAHLWAPWPGASDQEARGLRDAHAVLQRWIAQRFITVFFETVAMDPDRKAFWLRYAPHVSRFRIYGDTLTRRRLNEDARLRPFLPGRFCLGTAVNGSNAMMMHVKSKTVVVFGEVGNALYVYDADGDRAPSYDKCYPSANQLKRPSMPLLYRSEGGAIYGLREAGRVIQHYDWERKLAKWLQLHLGI